MKFKPKKWYWILTWPFAHNNYTLIGKTLHYPKGLFPSETIIRHEMVHVEQKEKYGTLHFLFKYLFLLPLFYNPFRYRVEYQAYKAAQGYSDDRIHKILSSYRYGWLLWRS